MCKLEPHKLEREDGFSVLELLIVVALVVVISTFAVVSIKRSRDSIRLQNSARTFATYVEKARLDAIRRHDTSRVDITGSNSYDIYMDFNGTGNPFARSFTLESGVVFTDSGNNTLTVNSSGDAVCPNGEQVPWADFDIRGRTTECTMLFRFQNGNSERSTVQVVGSGDVTINTDVVTPANVNYTSVNANSDVVSSAIVKGTKPPFSLSPCGSSGGSSGGGPIVVGTCAAGEIKPDTALVTIRRNGGSTATVNITVNTAGTITATPNSNLAVTPTTSSVTSSSGGTFAFTISSITKSRNIFPVTFTNPCSSTSVQVKVVN
jgi:prepilin-type N-terminal cleavage/methylation domain-containing protein